MTVIVRRSAIRMWLMAIGGIPLLLIALDVLTNRRISDWLRGIVFTGEDTQLFEPRDLVWAWAMAVFALFLVGWGLKELFAPTKVVHCRPEGLALSITGPRRSMVVIPWSQIIDVSGREIEDEGAMVPMLVVEVRSTKELPTNPWGARWISDNELGVLAEDWPEPPEPVASRIGDYAVELARRERRERRAQGSRVWEAE